MFDVENISVRWQHDACNSWGVIMFVRQYDLGLIIVLLCSKMSHSGQYQTYLRLGC